MSDNIIRYERDDEGIVTLTMDDPNAGANTMNAAYKAAMGETIDRLEAERDDITGVVLTSGKKTFFAGGNLADLQKISAETVGDSFREVEDIKAQLRRLEQFGKPVVAAINGAALGGGLEITLACHHRIAVDDDKIKLGLPEVSLGLLPGGGGVTRLVRMLGIQEALMGWLLQGQQRSPKEALAKGVIDELVATREELVPAAKAWILAHKDDATAATKPWDVKGYKIPGGTPTTPAFAANLPAFPANLRKQLKGSPIKSPRAIMSAAVEGAQVDFDTASRIESRYFAELTAGRESTAMIQAFFFDLQSINSGALRPAGIDRSKVSKVGILGAGMMGAGNRLLLRHLRHRRRPQGRVSIEGAEKGKAYTAKLLDAKVAKGRLSQEDRDATLARITPTADAADLADVDAVIEAVFEDHDLKKKVFAEVEAVVGPDTLLCSNTSTLPITGLQGFATRPADFIGLHFFSPVDKMKLVEIIRGEHTSDTAAARAIDLVQQIRKIPVVVGDGRGFYTSRVFGTLIIEGAQLLAEGVDPQTIERAATSAGFPAPPLAMLDEVSLTLTQHIRSEAAKAAAAEGRELASTPGEEVIDSLVALGRKGRAAGAGLYDYPEGAPKVLWPELRERWSKNTQIPLRDLQDRYLFRMALETATCFEEGVLTDAQSANIGGIFGIGFPPHTGGPATFMTNYEGGLAGFVARANELADTYGERFRPSAWLTERAASGTLVDAPVSAA